MFVRGMSVWSLPIRFPDKILFVCNFIAMYDKIYMLLFIEILDDWERKWIMYKNIEKQAKIQLKDQVAYQSGQVVSKTLVQNDAVSMTIFSFDKGEEISTHAAGGDAMVTVLEGTGRFTVGGEVFFLKAGETLIMPKDIPHAVYGEERFKMQLVVSY